ncbi:MAG: hypothetical protein ACW99F_14745 [Candidatus Hodarchaeales archaeon]
MWEESTESTFFFMHGIGYWKWWRDTYDESNSGWWMGHPYDIEIIFNGEPILTRRYSEPIDVNGPSPGNDLHFWNVYRIFEPGDLEPGDYYFNIFYYATHEVTKEHHIFVFNPVWGWNDGFLFEGEYYPGLGIDGFILRII